MLLEILLLYIANYICTMYALCFDNITWIPADRNWYYTNEWRKYFKVLFIIKGKEYIFPITKEGWKIVRSRIKAVLTHQYDIIPALISSLKLAIIQFILIKLLFI